MSSFPYKKLFFIGITGTGMSAIAQYVAMSGVDTLGSDRAVDSGDAKDTAKLLESMNITIYPQDGSGITKDIDAIVVSTAIENTVIDMKKAKELNIPVLHRADLLAEITRTKKTISVAGTSGKSTVAAMIFSILNSAKKEPSIITGGNLIELKNQKLTGNCFVGNSDWLVIEADESDGSLVKYTNEYGLLLNMDRDHKEESELLDLFLAFKNNSKKFIINTAKENLEELAINSIGFSIKECSSFSFDATGSDFVYKKTKFRVPLPGKHNIENAISAIEIAIDMNLEMNDIVKGLAEYKGVERRFQILGTKNSITVVDDYAHNPAKIQAVLKTVRMLGSRILVFFQPHGFGPTKFMKDELILILEESLSSKDIYWMPEIFYAGGSADKSISSKDIIDALSIKGKDARFFEDRHDVANDIISEASEGDIILLMGARDPSLEDFAQNLYKNL